MQMGLFGMDAGCNFLGFEISGLGLGQLCLNKQNQLGLVELHWPFSKMGGMCWMHLGLEMFSEPNFLKFKGMF